MEMILKGEKRMKKLGFIVICLVLVMSMSMSALAAPKTLKVGHVLAPTHPYQIGLEKFAELVQAKTNGSIVIKAFHSSQLGGEREMIESLQFGTLDMTLVSTAPLAGFLPEFQVFDLPFIFESREIAYRVLDGQIGQDLLKKLDKKGIIGLAYWENGFRHVTNSRRPITTPADLSGLKIRLMENPVHMDSFRAMGALPTPMAFGELFTALQQGTVDGQENPLAIIETSKFYEVQKYISLTGHFYAASPLLISKTVWNKLSEKERTALMEAAKEAGDFERAMIIGMDNELSAKMKEKGMEVTVVDKSLFKQATKSVYDKYESIVGKELLDSVRNAK